MLRQAHRRCLFLHAPIMATSSRGNSVNVLLSAINAADTAFLTESTAIVGSPANPQPDQTGGGVWARGIGGEQTTRGTTTTNYPVAGTTSCQTETLLDFAGVQIGTDISTLNFYGWNIHLGSTLGYLGATGKDVTSPGSGSPLGGTLSDSLEIPFAGVYASVTKGGFFLDGMARELYFQNTASDWQASLFGQHFDARSFAVNGDAGYNFQLQDNWFIEPSAGFIWSTTELDPLHKSGALSTLPGVVTVSQIYDAIGRLSVKAGTTVDTGNIILQPFGTASVFREFEGNPTGTVNADGPPATSANFAMTGLGTYGQFGLGLAGQLKDTGWLGYIRADYRTGENIQGWSVSGGLRYQFSPDMVGRPFITKGPEPEPIVSVYNWTGLRVGAVLGADWGYSNWSFADGTATSPRFAGILPGGLIGYDYQIGKWVIGAGADMGWTNAQGAAGCLDGASFTCENQADWLATATGRVGYTFWGDRILSYAKAGLAAGNFTVTYSCDTGCPGGSASKTSVGWTIGAGTEFALNKDWSVRAETNYFDLGKDDYSPSGIRRRLAHWSSPYPRRRRSPICRSGNRSRSNRQEEFRQNAGWWRCRPAKLQLL